MRYILRPDEIPGWCTLLDALFWLGTHLYPPGNRYDLRVFDPTDSIGIVLQRAEEHRSFAAATGITYPSALDALFAKGPKSESLQGNDAAWYDQMIELDRFNELVESYRAELYLLLRHGKLTARGVRTHSVKPDSAARDWARSEALVEIRPDPYLREDPAEIIPAEHWRMDNVDWYSGISLGPNGRYELISVRCDQLFSTFPEPEAEVFEAQNRGGTIVVDVETPSADSESTRRRRGRRPKYDWPAFLLQVIVIANTERLPEKQDALVAQMMEWCEQNWGVKPGTSTVREKLQPIYAALKKSQ